MKVHKYRNKFRPEIVFAVRWNKFGDHPAVTEKIKDTEDWETCGHIANVHGKLVLDDGRVYGVCPGSWIICLSDGTPVGWQCDKQFRHIYAWYWRPW